MHAYNFFFQTQNACIYRESKRDFNEKKRSMFDVYK